MTTNPDRCDAHEQEVIDLNDKIRDLLERLEKAEAQLKEANRLLDMVPNSIWTDSFNEGRKAFLAAQKEEK